MFGDVGGEVVRLCQMMGLSAAEVDGTFLK